MGTLAASHERRRVLQTRGTWKPREDRTMYAVCVGLLWVGMIAGFSLDFPKFSHQVPAAPTIVYVHAAVFTGWLLILTAQVMLVMTNRVRWHMTLGWLSLGWAGLMMVVGPWAAISLLAVQMKDAIPHAQFLAAQLAEMLCFATLLGWGVSLRKNSAAHKRVMILATVALAAPGFDRITTNLLTWKPSTPLGFFWLVFYGNVLLVALMALWDWRRGRLMRQFVVGAAGMLATLYAAGMLYYWGPWQATALGWVQAWARTFG